ncbi:MAG: DUF1501 domain-containing protein [Planctomycetia bacterium]|nr:DUF1501 domain-containing protein [Planctomycetia bacterium]
MWSSFLHRRDALRVGSLTAAATLLPVSGRCAEVAGAPSLVPTADSVIFLNMMGGVTHHESFDPKPDAPEDVRGILSPIATTLPGIQFAEVCPNLAKIAHKIALVRSYSHTNNDHLMSQAYALSGRPVGLGAIQKEPNIGSIVAHLKGPRNDLPGYIAVPGFTRPGPPPYDLFVGGWLGREHAPFCAAREPKEPDFTKGPLYKNPKATIDEQLEPASISLPTELSGARLSARAELRALLDNQLRAGDVLAAHNDMDAHYRNAFRMLSSTKVRDAFDVSGEPLAVRETYGRTKIGGRVLMARRLVEAGARFVMVDYGYDPEYGNLWDNHNVAAQNFPVLGEMAKRPYHVAGMDRAFAALLNDLETRGLLARTLVVFITEFGRTPRINNGGGRDHWGPCGSIFFAGGGTQRGTVIGTTDRNGAYPTSEANSPADVAASIYRALGIDIATRLLDPENRPHFVLPEGRVIPGLFA